jgi:hypothetical protein
MVEAALERRLRLVAEMLEQASAEVQEALQDIHQLQRGVNHDRREDTPGSAQDAR